MCCLKDDQAEVKSWLGSVHRAAQICQISGLSIRLRIVSELHKTHWTVLPESLLLHGPRDLANERAFLGTSVYFLQLAPRLWFSTPRCCGSSLKPRANIKLSREHTLYHFLVKGLLACSAFPHPTSLPMCQQRTAESAVTKQLLTEPSSQKNMSGTLRQAQHASKCYIKK